MFRKLILFSLLCMPLLLHAQQFRRLDAFTPDQAPGAAEHVIDDEHLLLDLTFKPEQKLVIGTATHIFRPIRKEVDSIWLDAVGIRFKEVKLDGKDVKYKTNSQGISIFPEPALKWDTRHTLTIQYEANPRRGLYFIGWNDTTGRSRKQIWSQGQGTDNRHWIPAFDDPNDKLVTEMRVTVEDKFRALSNGSLLSEKKNKNGFKTYQYKISHPHALYLVMLGIGDYAIHKGKSPSGVPLEMWYYPDQPQTLEPSYRYTGQIMDFLEKETGVPYPWEKYAQIPVQEFLYGAMENTSATVFGDFFLVDARGFLDRNYVNVNAHEMAHQWFGDYVTAKNIRDHWLQESFATHYAKLADRHIFGEDHYQWNRRNEQNQALAASEKDLNPIAHSGAGRARWYPKGSFVLDMLKHVIGREQYNRAVKHYLQQHAYGNVTSYDFKDAFHDALGMNLDWFFDQWIFHGGEPHYKVGYEQITQNGQALTVFTVDQIQQLNGLVGYFRMPIEFEVHYADGTSSKVREWVDGATTRVAVPNPDNKLIAFVLFDPGNQILKKVTFEKPEAMLLVQALKAPLMIDRYDALVALQNVPLERKRETLQKAFGNETFHATRSEIVRQLARDPQSLALLGQALRAPDHRVRLASVNALDTIPASLRTDVERLLDDSSYSVIEAVLEKLVRQYPEDASRYLKQADKIDGLNKGLRITWLKLSYLYEPSRRDAVLKELTDYVSPSYEFRTRINAMNALKSLNYLDQQAIGGMYDALVSFNSRLSAPAQEVINHFLAQEEMKSALIKHYRNHTYSEADAVVIRKTIGL